MTILDDGSRTLPMLDAQVRTILARLELVSGAATNRPTLQGQSAA